jgi:hypothetical protein
MDLTNYTDDELSKLKTQVKTEIKRRATQKKFVEIRASIDKYDYHITYPMDILSCPTDLFYESITLPVTLTADTRSKYDIHESAEVDDYDYKAMSENINTNDLPKIDRSQHFDVTSEWKCSGDWDDPLEACGKQNFYIWFKRPNHLDKRIYRVLTINDLKENLIVKRNDDWAIYVVCDDEPTDNFLDLDKLLDEENFNDTTDLNFTYIKYCDYYKYHKTYCFEDITSLNIILNPIE